MVCIKLIELFLRNYVVADFENFVKQIFFPI